MCVNVKVIVVSTWAIPTGDPHELGQNSKLQIPCLRARKQRHFNPNFHWSFVEGCWGKAEGGRESSCMSKSACPDRHEQGF